MKYLLSIALIMGLGCTENVRSRAYGVTSKVDLPSNMKLVNITWKNADLWYLVRPMREDESEETYYFHESSNFGVFEGNVKLVEHK